MIRIDCDFSLAMSLAVTFRIPSASIRGDIDAGLLAEFGRQVFLDDAVHIRATELGIAAGGLDHEHTLAEFHDRDVERAAAEIDDGDPQVLAEPIETIGERSGSRFVDQTHDLKPGDPVSVLGCTPLIVIEIRRNRDHRLHHRLAEKCLGVALDLLQQESGKFLRREFLVPQPNLLATAHLSLECRGGAFRVGGSLAASRLTDDHLAVCGERT